MAWDAAQILIIGAAEPYTRPRGLKLWLRAIPQVFDGGCSYWWFFMDVATERPIRFACNGHP